MIETSSEITYFNQIVEQMTEDSVKSLVSKSLRSVDELPSDECKLEMEDMVNVDDFHAAFANQTIHYALSSNTTNVVEAENYRQFVEHIMPTDNTKYMFHNVTADFEISLIMRRLIPLPAFLPVRRFRHLRICRLYAGGQYSGTNVHNHSAALNYLISGKKFWFTFPFNDCTREFIENNDMEYGQVSDFTITWFEKNYETLLTNKSNLDIKFFTQNSGEVLFIPDGYYHGVINMEDSVGITYSWT